MKRRRAFPLHEAGTKTDVVKSVCRTKVITYPFSVIRVLGIFHAYAILTRKKYRK